MALWLTANSRVVSREEEERDGRYGEAAMKCVGVARLLGVTAPIRIDVRRFALFDVNMKPVS